MADDGEIDIEGEFDFKLEVEDGFYDANELPSKSANLLPEFTNPPWMLEQGWTMDSYMDEKSKATIERMLMEEQQYLNGRSKSKMVSSDKSPSSSPTKPKSNSAKRPWNEEEKQLFLSGLDLYGRSWTRISEIIPTRTSLQVKNYAQQYFKNLAKKADAASAVVSSTSRDLPLGSTQLTSHLSQSADPLANVLASVTTAQPTVTSFSSSANQNRKTSLSKQSKNKKKSQNSTKADSQIDPAQGISNGLDGVLPSANTIVGISGLQDLQCGSYTGNVDTSELSPSVNLSGVGFLSGSKELGFDSSVGTLIHIASALDTLAAVVESDFSASDLQTLTTVSADGSEVVQSDILASVVQQPEGKDEALQKETDASSDEIGNLSSNSVDEEEDVDIDIENDDDDIDNPILLGRSASPSSVYEKLLRSANVTPTELGDGEQSDEGDTDADVAAADVDSVTQGRSEKLEGAMVESVSECFTDNKQDAKVSASGTGEYIQPEPPMEYCESCEEGNVLQDVPKIEEKVIVNGITTSAGEVIEFPIPEEERILEPDDITDEERKIHSEFFDGRQSKTPERYLKIRNHIIDCWKKCKPNFLNKTSVRTGLKNCGDVNCIGRIHCFLECTGTINFGCEQACYNNPGKTQPSGTKLKHTGRDGWMAIASDKLDSMRPRKRRIRDSSGHWVDEKELEGKTIEHKTGPGEERKVKVAKMMKVSYDPFKLIPCQPFTADRPAPFKVSMTNTAVAVMDVHAHISKTEVIGMLGGQYHGDLGVLDIRMAVPCNSLSTGIQCEMDPVSQTQASEQISAAGLIVVGWYHSHPTFAPNPSVRDIETQLKFQDWFAKGGSHFVGVIVSPYNKLNPGVISEVQCLTIGSEMSPEYHCNLPYEFDYSMTFDSCTDGDLVEPLIALADKYSSNVNRVYLSRQFRVALGISCLTKMVQSVRHHLLPPSDSEDHDARYDSVIQLLEDTFLKLCSMDSKYTLQDHTTLGDFDEHSVPDIHIDDEDLDTFVPANPQLPLIDT
ncbi:LOW QUALITY PROTEIN: deubiquitinase MYSM1-like [Haliotis rubra]|uniref:LOW QUALITY PROTEIN: deubiquitinase MYSM1-like n=1 Tax=Haliotis rubra TaxID=36100 RepID=UPI001EE57DF5|nr:LOW QUALITY PROTEIN: deubiquitinase MYSM1-like [Haliotis rubra]